MVSNEFGLGFELIVVLFILLIIIAAYCWN
ncbi:YjcZ family sporulation protein [Neobacillus vireti]